MFIFKPQNHTTVLGQPYTAWSGQLQKEKGHAHSREIQKVKGLAGTRRGGKSMGRRR